MSSRPEIAVRRRLAAGAGGGRLAELVLEAEDQILEIALGDVALPHGLAEAAWSRAL